MIVNQNRNYEQNPNMNNQNQAKNQGQMGVNPNMNPNVNGNNFNPYMMNAYMQNMQQQNNKQNMMTQNPPKMDNMDFVRDIQKILSLNLSEERTELLGETIFYFLQQFIAQYKLNNTEGMFDDIVLCSKLTGILLQTEEGHLIEIVSNNDILILTIKDVINV